MAGGDRRKCKCCLKLFRPDPRNRHHQRYCSVPACRAASKAASQARWLAVAENQGYFRGPVNVARVQAWRSQYASRKNFPRHCRHRGNPEFVGPSEPRFNNPGVNTDYARRGFGPHRA
jgi:hypothetical protein